MLHGKLRASMVGAAPITTPYATELNDDDRLNGNGNNRLADSVLHCTILVVMIENRFQGIYDAMFVKSLLAAESPVVD